MTLKDITTTLDPARFDVEVGDKVEMPNGRCLTVCKVFKGSIFFYETVHTRQLGAGRTETYKNTSNWERLEHVVKIFRVVPSPNKEQKDD